MTFLDLSEPVVNASGTSSGSPYVIGAAGGIAAGAFIDIPIQIKETSPVTINYTTKVFAGGI